MAPPMRMVSARSSSLSITWILSVTLAPAENDQERPRRALQFVMEIGQFLFHEEAGNRRQMCGHAGGRTVRAVGRRLGHRHPVRPPAGVPSSAAWGR